MTLEELLNVLIGKCNVSPQSVVMVRDGVTMYSIADLELEHHPETGMNTVWIKVEEY